MWVRGGGWNRAIWTVNRRWLPWRPRLSKRAGEVADVATVGDLLGETPLGGLIVLLGLIVVLALLLLVLAEWFIALLLVPVLVLIRLTGLFPWVIVARRWDGMSVSAVYYKEVTGWRAAWQLIRTAKHEIRENGVPGSMSLTS